MSRAGLGVEDVWRQCGREGALSWSHRKGTTQRTPMWTRRQCGEYHKQQRTAAREPALCVPPPAATNDIMAAKWVTWEPVTLARLVGAPGGNDCGLGGGAPPTANHP